MKKVFKKKTLIIAALAILVVAAACFGYVNNYYHSDVSIQEFQNDDQVEVTEMQEGLYLDGAGEEHAIIFYPGAKVEYTSYLPLFYDLASEGIDCFLVKMPCNLAILGQNKAEKIMDSYDYEQWYLAGHSLGGAMAASYAAKHLEKLDGLVLLAAYPTNSLQSDSFSVVSIYGSEDGVLNMEKLENGRSLMPSDYAEILIEGGNHAWFGNYGEQKGDNPAKISREEQQEQTVDGILQMIEGHRNGGQEEKNMENEQSSALESKETIENEPISNEESRETGEYEQISAKEAKEIMENEEDVLILDVRTREEFDTGHIKGAICLPNEEILEDPEDLPDREQTILVYCRSGNRSKQAAQKLADMGYEKVVEFGGIMDWPYPEWVE